MKLHPRQRALVRALDKLAALDPAAHARKGWPKGRRRLCSPVEVGALRKVRQDPTLGERDVLAARAAGWSYARYLARVGRKPRANERAAQATEASTNNIPPLAA